MKSPKTQEGAVSITEIELTRMQFHVVGESPLVPHAVSLKARQQLIEPPGKKNEAEKATTKKHEPFDEYREAAKD